MLCRSLDMKGSVGISSLTPEMSKLSNLSALCISYSIEDYGPTGSLLNLQELTMSIDGSCCSLNVPFPAASLFKIGALTRLTKLEISSCEVLGQVYFLSPSHAFPLLGGRILKDRGHLSVCRCFCLMVQEPT